MPTHVALLRGINVGGHNRVAMADLRTVVAGRGHRDVSTYIASGNVVFTSDSADDADALADELEQAIADELAVTPAVVVLTRDELAAIVAANPYPDVVDGRHVHAVFHRQAEEPDAAVVAEAEVRARTEGSGDSATVVGRTVYLHTPDGLGRSRLAELLNRGDAVAAGTTRNWRTVTRLVAMVGD